MRLYTFEIGGRRRLGVEGCGGQLIDLPAAHGAMRLARDADEPHGALCPPEMLGFLRGGQRAMDLARRTVAFMDRRPALPAGDRLVFTFDEVRLHAPVPRPGKILCPGVNFRSRIGLEPGASGGSDASFSIKVASTVIGPGDAIVRPRYIRQMDYGVELAAVIGRTMRYVSEAEVASHIAGFTILQDVTARDAVFHRVTIGKNFDTFCPMGPCLVTVDEIPDLSNLGMRAWVNSRLCQRSSTRDWIMPLPKLLAALSAVMTLEPGDIVSSGTPGGTATFQDPPSFLSPGDTVALEIDRIGRLQNPVTEAPSAAA